MEEIERVPCLAAASCMHCSSESLLIWIYVSLGSCILNFMLPTNVSLLFCQKYGLLAYIMSALLWSCIWNWCIQSLIIALCAVLVLRHRNRIGCSTSIFRNHNLESFRILASLPVFLQCIMLAHQAALYIKWSFSIEVINTNWKPYWLNESKYLWNVLMCPFVLHAANSIVASHWHMLIIGSSQSTVLLTPLNLSLIILKMQNLFSNTWFPNLQFIFDLELTSLNVCLSTPKFALSRGTVSWSQRTQ